MFKKSNYKWRRLFIIISFFVFMLSLSACSSAGNPSGKLDKNQVYLKAGNYTVTNGELWNELKWSAHDILEEKSIEVVMSDYYEKVELVMNKNFADLTDEQKNKFGENFNNDSFVELKKEYESRIEDYVIEDIYNFTYNSKNSFDAIEDVNEYEAKKAIIKYSNEIYVSYGLKEINGTSIVDICTNAPENRENYLIIAKELKNLYYVSLAKELLAYDNINEDIKEAYDNRDVDNEDDLGYFTKTEYTNKFKNEFANQQELNVILIRFSTEDEFYSTLRSFGIKQYNNTWIYLPNDGMNFSEYCEYYDDITTSEIGKLTGEKAYVSLNSLAIANIYVQIYNYIYGGYRDYLLNEDYKTTLESSVDFRKVTEDIINDSQSFEDNTALLNEINKISNTFTTQRDPEGIDTFFTRKEINDIDTSFNTYLYETLCLPKNNPDLIENATELDDDSLSYSTDVKTYNSTYWIAFKFTEGEDQYADIYDKNTVEDDLYDSIAENVELKEAIEKLLKQDKMSESLINSAVEERKSEVSIKIFDEALEISYANEHTDYSKTYGKAPNSNVIATLKYNKKTWNLNIVEDTTDENAVSGGVYDILELRNGSTTAIDILSKKVVKDTKAYEETAEDIEDYELQIEYVLAAFASDYYASSGYSSSIGKYNFMMLYFHTANIKHIIRDIYRVNGASAKILTNYNSDDLLDFFKTYTDQIYDNYFSITGKRLVVYLDANDDTQKDDITEWNATQKEYAKELVLKINDRLASTTGAHTTALSTIVTEINESARSTNENPIAPENMWAKYRHVGLNVELLDVTATNSTTDLDFALKARLLQIYESEFYSINNTTPTEYIENLETPNQVLETEDGYNLLVITSADFQTSAEFKAEDDKLGLFKNMEVFYNEEYHKIESVYNEDKKLSKEQIRLYVLEYVTSNTSNLSPSQITTALTNFLSPVITRYTNTDTQRDIIIYFIEHYAGNLEFTTKQERFNEIVKINHQVADDYISIYFDADTTNTLKTYENWWTDLQNIVGKILHTEGESK